MSSVVLTGVNCQIEDLPTRLLSLEPALLETKALERNRDLSKGSENCKTRPRKLPTCEFLIG